MGAIIMAVLLFGSLAYVGVRSWYDGIRGSGISGWVPFLLFAAIMFAFLSAIFDSPPLVQAFAR